MAFWLTEQVINFKGENFPFNIFQIYPFCWCIRCYFMCASIFDTGIFIFVFYMSKNNTLSSLQSGQRANAEIHQSGSSTPQTALQHLLGIVFRFGVFNLICAKVIICGLDVLWSQSLECSGNPKKLRVLFFGSIARPTFVAPLHRLVLHGGCWTVVSHRQCCQIT